MPWRGASNEYPQHMFLWRNKKNINTYGLKKSTLTSAMISGALCMDFEKEKKNGEMSIMYLHLWTQIRSNCHVERFVVKRIINQYKNRMFIHCRCGLYRKAWLSRDIYLSCLSQYWRGIKQGAMLTNRYGRSFQWGKSLSKDQKSYFGCTDRLLWWQ